MKGIIFDMDGTLLDSMFMWSDVGNEFIKRIGVPFLHDIQLVEEGATYNEKTLELIETYHLDETLDSIKMKFDSILEDVYRNIVVLKPNVYEFVKKCHDNNIKMCVATATSSYLAEMCLDRLGLAKMMQTIISTKDFGKNKFKPDIFLHCANLMRLSVDEVVVFEDALYAAETAKNAGFKVVGIFEECFKEDYPKMQRLCDVTVDSFQELINKFNEL